jgi:hypothetical protein
MSSKTRSEDTLIFNALTPEITNMRIVYEAIEEFCKVKKEADPSERFNIILFQEDGPNYLEDFTLNAENVLIALKSLEPMIVKANVAGGIFVALTFIIQVFKIISEKCFRLIILTDSGSLRIPNHFIPVLQNLIDNVYTFPFFIDIVRIDIDDPREDLKLMRLARRCNGDIHEINDARSLEDILAVLSLKREITSLSLISDKSMEIAEENRPFYENLAEDPEDVKEEDTCSICFQKDTKGIVKCKNCETVAHKKCWAHWAKNTNIGLFNVFRCHKCYNLIKLDQEYVFAVRQGKEPAEEVAKVEEIDYLTYLQSLETEEGPQIIRLEDPLALSADDFEWEEEGDDGLDFGIDLDVDKIMEESYEALSDDDVKIIWCPNCNKITTNEFKECPSCQHPL